jgi:hypothetical protein
MTRKSLPSVTKSKNDYQQSRRKCGPETKSREDAISKNQKNIEEDISIYYTSIRQLSASTNMTKDWPRISNTEFTSRMTSPFTENNSNFQKNTTDSSKKHWMNG